MSGPNMSFILTMHFEPPKGGQPLYKGQNVPGVLYMEVWTTVQLLSDYHYYTVTDFTLWGWF